MLCVWLDIPRTISEYWETRFTVVNGIRLETVGGRKKRRDSGSVEFAGRLTAIVQNMFSETVTDAMSNAVVQVAPISGLRSFFDNDDNGVFILNPSQVLDSDLLCYLRGSRRASFVPRDRLDAVAGPNASGVTWPLPTGVVSEAWLSECGLDLYGVANTIYHELMHNKTNFAAGENANWVHGSAGGGGLAAAENAGPLAAFTRLNKLAMARRFPIRNRQFTDGLR
jgi:hypothetical protein